MPSNELDYGGLTIVVDGVRVGATAPGQAGTLLSGSEITLLDGLTAGTVTASKAVVVDANKAVDTLTFTTGQQTAATSRTATSDGATTGIIAAGTGFVSVTSANADHIITLPAPVIGNVVRLINGATGYELRTSAPATIGINGGTGAGAESAIAATTLVTCVCTSATNWVCVSQLADGTIAATQVAAA